MSFCFGEPNKSWNQRCYQLYVQSWFAHSNFVGSRRLCFLLLLLSSLLKISTLSFCDFSNTQILSLVAFISKNFGSSNNLFEKPEKIHTLVGIIQKQNIWIQHSEMNANNCDRKLFNNIVTWSNKLKLTNDASNWTKTSVQLLNYQTSNTTAFLSMRVILMKYIPLLHGTSHINGFLLTVFT